MDLPGDGKTIDDPELLMEAMEAREALHEAGSIEAVDALAAQHGLRLAGDRAMPANNRSIWWIKS